MVNPVGVGAGGVDRTPRATPQLEPAAELIQTNTIAGRVNADRLGGELAQRTAGDPDAAATLIRETLDQLPRSDREAVARALVDALPQQALTALAGATAGRDALQAIDAELATADVRLGGNDPQRTLVQRAAAATTSTGFNTVAAPPELTSVTQGFIARFKDLAQDPSAFHAALKDTFGTNDQTRAEQIRVATLSGDTRWMPRVAVVAGGDGQVLGAYASEHKTILLNQSVLNDPMAADAVFAEEMGHHLETLVRQGDSRGDEGAVFARTLLGEDISPRALDALRRENDQGTLTVNGQQVAVEFSRFNAHMFANGGPIAGKEVALGDGQTMVRLSGYDMDVVGASHAGPVVNGRVVGPQDGFSEFRLERIAGTHNNYTLAPDTTPYNAVANATGVDWQILDKAWVDLTAQGKTDEATALRAGSLPPLESYSSALQAELKPHYDRIAQEAKAPVAQTPASAPATPASTGPFANGGPIPGDEFEGGDGQMGVRVSGMDVDIAGATNEGPLVNGRVVTTADGFSNFNLVKIAGTHNNYTLTPGTTPYDGLAHASGIEWQTLDKAYLELTAQGNTPAAELLRQGTLPPITAFQDGAVKDSLQPYYTQLTQQVALRHDATPDETNAALAELYTSDPKRAGEILLGRGELGLNLDDAVAESFRGAQDRVYGASFETIQGVVQAAHIYVAAEALPEAKRDALRTTLNETAAAAGGNVETGFRAAIDLARQGGPADSVQPLTEAYSTAYANEGSTSAVNEIGQLAAVASVYELRAASDALIEQSGHQVAYDTIEARFQDEGLAAVPAPLQQPLRDAIKGELGRINALEILATQDVPTFSGDVTADAKLLGEHQDNLLPYLSASVQTHGVEQTLINTAAAVQHHPEGPERQALLAAIDTGLEALRGDIAFKQAERADGSLVQLKDLVATQEQIRAQYGEDAAVTQSIESFVDSVDQNISGQIGGIDIRVMPVIDYGSIAQQPEPLSRDQIWLYASDEALRFNNPEALALRNVDPETLDVILDTDRERVDYADASLRQGLLDAQLSVGGDATAIAAKNENNTALAGMIASGLDGKTIEQQRETLANGGLGMAVSNLGIRLGNGFNANAIDYVLGTTDPNEQRSRINDVLTTGQALSDLQTQARRAEALGSSKEFELGGGSTPGGAIPFIESAVERTVAFGIRRDVIDSAVQQDTERAALGLTGWTAASTDSEPPVKIEMSAWATAFAARVGEDEAAKHTGLQIATSLSYVNRATTLGEQKIRAEHALQALITTHKIGTPPITLGEIGADMISVDPSWHEVRSRHYDEVSPYIGLPQGPNDERFSINLGDWDYRLLNDENGAVVAAAVREESDTPTNAIVSGVLTVASFIPVVNAVAIPLNAVYQAAQGIENGNYLQAAAGIFGVTGQLASGTLGAVATTTSEVLTAADSVVNAVETGDPLAIAGAVFSAAGTVSDGIGVFNADAELGGFSMAQVTTGFEMASASTSIMQGVRDGQLALGLHGLSEFTGAYGDFLVASDKDANFDRLDLIEDGLGIAGDVADVDIDDPFDIASTALSAASDTVGAVAEFTGTKDINGTPIGVITAGLDAGSDAADLGQAIEEDNLGAGIVALGNLTNEIDNAINAGVSGADTGALGTISDTLTVGGHIVNEDHDRALQIAVENFTEAQRVPREPGFADSLAITDEEALGVGNDTVRNLFDMDNGTLADRLTELEVPEFDVSFNTTVADLPDAPLDIDLRPSGNGNVEFSVNDLLRLRETGDLFRIDPATFNGSLPTLTNASPSQRLNNPVAGQSAGTAPWQGEVTRPDYTPEQGEITRPDYSGAQPGDARRFDALGTAASDAAQAQRLSESARQTIDNFSNWGGLNLQEDALGRYLAETTGAGGLATVEAVIEELPDSDQDDVVRAMLDNLSATQLTDLAATDDGLDLIKSLRLPVSTGVITPADAAGLDSLNTAFYSNTEHLDFVIEVAGLADNIYEPSGAPAGWSRLNDRGMPPALAGQTWQNESTGFNAALYRSDTGQIVLVYEGTNDEPFSADGKRDWGNNAQNALGLSSAQYESAIVLAESVRQYYGDEVVVTGHSLGGGLTAAASTVTGLDGYTFNAAGVHNNTLSPYNVSRDQALGHIEAYAVNGDVVTTLQHPLITGSVPIPIEVAPDAAGHRFALPALAEDGSSPSLFEAHPVDRHGMGFVIRGLEAQRAP